MLKLPAFKCVFVDLENSKDWGEFSSSLISLTMLVYLSIWDFLVSGYGLLYIEMILERLVKFYKT